MLRGMFSGLHRDYDAIAVGPGLKDKCKARTGGHMHITHIVVGVIVALAVIASISILPDFIRYMKIRSM
jgi:hypothetical protein